MQKSLSHKNLDSEYFTKLRSGSVLMQKYESCKYTIWISPNLQKKGAPKFGSVGIEVLHEGNRRFVIISKEGDASQADCRRDRENIGKFIVLLATKLKYDLLRGVDRDNAGFLHSHEIMRLHEKNRSEVPPTIYGSLKRLLRNSRDVGTAEHFLVEKLFFEADQLYHLICSYGKTGSKKGEEDLVWWLNILPENVRFMDGDKIIPDELLMECLQKIFTRECLLGKRDIERFYDERIDGVIPGKRKTKTTDESHPVIAHPDSRI